MSTTFSHRERQVLQLLGAGQTSKEIADFLDVNISTVGSHRKSICRKLGIHSTAELICYAVIFRGSIRESELDAGGMGTDRVTVGR